MTCHQVTLENEIGLVSGNEAEPAESTSDTDIFHLSKQQIWKTHHILLKTSISTDQQISKLILMKRTEYKALQKVISYRGITD